MAIEDMYVKIFKALAHPIRIKIVTMLMEEALCVCKLNEEIEFSQSNLSQHLKILKDAGIVKSEKKGLKIIYSLKDEEIKNFLVIAERVIKNQINDMSNSLSIN